jgi:hypothetical protein
MYALGKAALRLGVQRMQRKAGQPALTYAGAVCEVRDGEGHALGILGLTLVDELFDARVIDVVVLPCRVGIELEGMRKLHGGSLAARRGPAFVCRAAAHGFSVIPSAFPHLWTAWKVEVRFHVRERQDCFCTF